MSGCRWFNKKKKKKNSVADFFQDFRPDEQKWQLGYIVIAKLFSSSNYSLFRFYIQNTGQ